jgi:hypothetical protein
MNKSIVSAGFIAASAVLSAAGCSSNNGSSGGADSPAGVVIGPPDDHCKASDGGLIVQTIGVCELLDPTLKPSNAPTCNVTFDQSTGTTGAAVDAGTDVDAGGYVSPYGPTMYGAAGNDDDCKYYVSWTATPIKVKADTYFTVTAVRLMDGMPATCAGVIPDVSFPGNLSVGVPTPKNPSTEIAPGVYKVGPLPFPESGIWQVRFHLFEECSDDPADSPHGHAAFFVQVP